MEDTYLEVENLIYHTVHDYLKSHSGDFEELVAEANLVFVKVYEVFDPSKGALSTLLVSSIWRRFIDIGRKKSNEKSVWSVSSNVDRGNGTLEDGLADHRVGEFNFIEFATGLTEDAKLVMKLALESPEELAKEAIGKGDAPRNWRSSIRWHLYNLGWSVDRVASSFEEVRMALN